VNRLLATNLSSQSAETIGKLLLEAFGELPSEKRDIVIGGYEFRITSIVERRIAGIAAKPAESRAIPESDVEGGSSSEKVTRPIASHKSETTDPPGRR